MRSLVISSMRNEGAFTLEWVTWYRMLGFTDILVVTNDCTDHSPQLLDALQDAGWLTHIRHEVKPDHIPLIPKLRRAKRHPLAEAADWILVCDVDEFLVIHKGAGQITDLLPAGEPDFLGMSLNWKVFGTSGQKHWSEGLVHRQFTRSAAIGAGVNTWYKAISRRADLFRRLDAHGPAGYHADRAPGPWGSAGLRWVNSEGVTVPDWHPDAPYQRQTPRELTTHAAAQMNHYMIRSEESFSLKRGTLSAAARKDRYTDGFFKLFNRNEVEDLSALRYAAAFEALHAEAMALPGIRELHHLCCADYVERLAAAAGREPSTDARWRRHRALASAGR
ncbi:MAG: glycosyltransferase family 2 protein [Frigidibacter sp.]|nr:glycosyltransferase family 2 protein [Frigidibacter sp.]